MLWPSGVALMLAVPAVTLGCFSVPTMPVKTMSLARLSKPNLPS